jgi:hypothetical protein
VEQDELKRNKYRYCVHKDELAIGVGRPWKMEKVKKKMMNAYPRIISNLGQMSSDHATSKLFKKMLTFMYHYCITLEDRWKIIDCFAGNWNRGHIHRGDYFTAEEQNMTKDILPLMFDQRTVGYAQTLGWAHPQTGDTMSTIMIGGLKTVVNGDFEVYTGDVLMWYWPFEKDCFKANGQRCVCVFCCLIIMFLRFFRNRKPFSHNYPRHLINADPTHGDGSVQHERDVALRDRFHEREFGQRPDAPKMVARIKPLVRQGDFTQLYDLERVIGIAIGCARPREKVDIKICRQSW